MKFVLKDLQNAKPEELAYAAGFFDGEGCILFKMPKREGGRPSLEIAVSQSEEGVLEVLRELLGGTINYTPPEKLPRRKDGNLARPRWVWRAGGRTARRALEYMHQYLWVKKREADLAFTFQEKLGHRKKLTDQDLKELRSLKIQLEYEREALI